MKVNWISVKEQMPKDGETVMVKTKHGTVREAIWIDDNFCGSRMSGWMINVTGNWRRNPGEPTHWRQQTRKERFGEPRKTGER